MNKPASATEREPRPGPPDRRQLLILTIVAGAILVTIAVAILIYLGLRGTGQTSVEIPAPTETAEPTATAFVSPVPEPSCETIISSGGVEMSVALPISLTVRGSTYAVEPVVPQEDAWTYPQDRGGQAVWVCGTVVNYVIGLEPTEENQALVGSLVPGDEIKLQLTSGTVLRFRFSERRDVEPGAEAALSQQRPRLTLMLPRSDRWEMATADYAAETESMAAPPSEALAEPGQVVSVDQARVTLLRGYVERRDDLPQGTAYYLTEFSVENVGEESLATDTISARLRDGIGNTYLISPRASEAGELGPLSGAIPAGESAQGTAGYLVPDPLPAGQLTWIFSLQPDSEEISVAIPHEGETSGGLVTEPPVVTINDAFLSDDGDTLVIEGEVRNRSSQALVVEPSEVSLSSSAGMSALSTSAPLLPWTIEPGQSQVIELQYVRPDASTALLELLGYSFEIGGLP